MSKYKTVERRSEIAIRLLQGSLERITENLEELAGIYGRSARIELDTADMEYVRAWVVYQDLETEEEFNTRMASREAARNERRERERQAYQTFLKLKARFQPDDEV
jgi:hypothetical protein